MTTAILLRDVTETDLPILFAQQLDPEASRMAAFPTRDRDAFCAHWTKILADDTVRVKCIVYEGQVAGNIVSFDRDGQREVGYWLGRDFWGKGIASAALAAFLHEETARPLTACAAAHNLASIRVLEKNGFRKIGVFWEFATLADQNIKGVMMKLE